MSASNFCFTDGLAIDPFGRVWVTDPFNDRALRFDWVRTSGQPADLVLGQPTMTSGGCNRTADQQTPTVGPTATGMCEPSAVTVDSFGRLYVVDKMTNRVLRFDRPRTNGEPATLALGQPDLTSQTLCDIYVPAPASASSLCSPAA